MTNWKLALPLATVLAGLAPVVAHAQSAIGGTVKDATGAVLPGVTVEAASPVLIEKAKTVVTDAEGNYKIVDLRPGTYIVTFTLEGFTTVKREGLELPSNFTATINAELKVGAIAEALTVTGSSPVVDVQTNVKAQVLPREVLDSVPSAKTIQSLGQLVVGVALSSPDVGGSRAMQQTYFAVHGVGAAGTMVTVDGLITNGTMADGGVQAYHNEAMTQEMVYLTAGGTAETITGGLNINLVPKDGGNRFMGGLKYAKSPAAWQGDNLTSELRAMGVGGVDRIDNFYEFNIEEGGPLLKDRVWFFGAFRRAHYDKPIANTFDLPAGVPVPLAFQQCRTAAIACEQGISDEKMDNPVVRLTWQISPRNKFAVYNDRAMRLRGHAMGANTDPATVSVVWHTPTFATGSAKWTSTVSSRLLLETGFSFNRERYDNVYQEGIDQPRGSAGWYRGARHNDTSTSLLWNASSAQLGNYPDRYNVMSAVSYITGSHNVKVGVQDSWGPYKRWNSANADLYQTYNGGTPFQVTVLNTPIDTGEYLDANFGVYAQDSWRLNRFTFNYGLRWDYAKQHVVGKPAQTGRFASSLPYDDIYLPVWKDFSPRLSAVYDVFGTGKTAIRFGVNKYMTAVTTGFAQIYNPTALTTQTLAWTDLNTDDIAQGERGCVYRTAGCEIDFSSLPTSFGVRSLSVFDPELRRPYQFAYNLGVSHEVFRGIALTAEWFRSDFKNLIARNNVARSASDYAAVNVASPIDGSTITVYNVSSAKVNQVQNVDSTDPNLKRTYNGIELNFNARLPRGARLFGGTSSEITETNSCSAATNDPNISIFCDGSKNQIPWQTSFKLAGTYPLPWYGISLSGSLQALAGNALGTAPLQYGVFTAGTGFGQLNGQGTFQQVTRTTTYPANCKGTCTPGALVIPGLTASSFNVPLVAPGTEFTPRTNQIDFGLSKNIKWRTASFTPKMDIFNAFNSDDYTAVSSTQYGAATYLQPSVILQGRIVRLGLDVKW
jgi:Carboxypeptidase regulatory-like domain